MRLEINTFARKGDVLDDENRLVGRVGIARGLSESGSVNEWIASLDEALRNAGYAIVEYPEVALPLTVETAVDRFTIQLKPVS